MGLMHGTKSGTVSLTFLHEGIACAFMCCDGKAESSVAALLCFKISLCAPLSADGKAEPSGIRQFADLAVSCEFDRAEPAVSP